MNRNYLDALLHLAQAGDGTRLALMRVVSHDSGNRYTAGQIEFDADGELGFRDNRTTTLVNLAEPPDSTGELPDGADVVALDMEGRWLCFVQRAAGAAQPCKVIEALGDASYLVRPQQGDGDGNLEDVPDADDFAAGNLAEQSLGPGSGVDVGEIVIVHQLGGATAEYVFDHPVYAKYLD